MPERAGGGVALSPQLPRNAFLLNFLLVSVGYFLIGQWKKGIAAIAAAIVVVPLTLGFGLPLFTLLTALDASLQAKQLLRGAAIRHWTFFNTPG